jgi:hypothetical protein
VLSHGLTVLSLSLKKKKKILVVLALSPAEFKYYSISNYFNETAKKTISKKKNRGHIKYY